MPSEIAKTRLTLSKFGVMTTRQILPYPAEALHLQKDCCHSSCDSHGFASILLLVPNRKLEILAPVQAATSSAPMSSDLKSHRRAPQNSIQFPCSVNLRSARITSLPTLIGEEPNKIKRLIRSDQDAYRKGQGF